MQQLVAYLSLFSAAFIASYVFGEPAAVIFRHRMFRHKQSTACTARHGTRGSCRAALPAAVP